VTSWASVPRAAQPAGPLPPPLLPARGTADCSCLARLRAVRTENAALRAENANMFTLLEENSELRARVETLQLQLECRPFTEDEEP
jgi:hypothetical protein